MHVRMVQHQPAHEPRTSAALVAALSAHARPAAIAIEQKAGQHTCHCGI